MDEGEHGPGKRFVNVPFPYRSPTRPPTHPGGDRESGISISPRVAALHSHSVIYLFIYLFVLFLTNPRVLVYLYPGTFCSANPLFYSQPGPSSTDISDWGFSEFGLYPPELMESGQMSPAPYAQLYPSSLIARVRDVCAPVSLSLEPRTVF